jgi:TetR/AcrR family transcriptional regulator
MTTEDNILQHARAIFFRKGLAGARMQEIADHAGINKAMLHYYFKTKEQLFEKVFGQAFEVFAGKIAEIFSGDVNLEEMITAYVNHTVDSLTENPGIPVFVMNELSYNPARITQLFAGKEKINLGNFKELVEKKTQGKTDAEALFIDMVALCVYPFVIAPVFTKLLHKTDQQYKDLLQSRKVHVINQILSRL